MVNVVNVVIVHVVVHGSGQLSLALLHFSLPAFPMCRYTSFRKRKSRAKLSVNSHGPLSRCCTLFDGYLLVSLVIPFMVTKLATVSNPAVAFHRRPHPYHDGWAGGGRSYSRSYETHRERYQQ